MGSQSKMKNWDRRDSKGWRPRIPTRKLEVEENETKSVDIYGFDGGESPPFLTKKTAKIFAK